MYGNAYIRQLHNHLRLFQLSKKIATTEHVPDHNHQAVVELARSWEIAIAALNLPEPPVSGNCFVFWNKNLASSPLWRLTRTPFVFKHLLPNLFLRPCSAPLPSEWVLLAAAWRCARPLLPLHPANLLSWFVHHAERCQIASHQAWQSVAVLSLLLQQVLRSLLCLPTLI